MPKLSTEARKELEALAAMPDSEIHTSDTPEIRELPSDAVVGRFYRPKKTTVTMRLDADVVAWLKASGEGYQTRINAYLRELMYRLSARRRANETTKAGRARVQVGLADGDLVEARVHRGKIVLTPKSVVDREYTPAQRRAIDARLEEGLADIEAGRTFGPFHCADEMIAHMEARRVKKPAAPGRKRSR